MGVGFSKLDNPSHEGETNTWLTPMNIIRSFNQKFDLDPCGFPNHLTAEKIICLPDDGLSFNWQGRVWLNPPYGRSISIWLDKLSRHGNGVALVFSRTETSWFQREAKRCDWIFFIKGRIRFLKPDFTESHNAGNGSCLIGYGCDFDSTMEGVLWVNHD